MQSDEIRGKSPSGSKRVRVSTGSGNANHPTKKLRSDTTRSKEKSAFLLRIMKGGEEYRHLSNEEVLEIRGKMIVAILSEDEDPLIDWIRYVNGRALCACHTLETVECSGSNPSSV